MTPEQRARRLIDGNDHMTIATADAAGIPWASPVFYVADTDSALYWVSGREARHSDNIRDNRAVAIVIYQTQPTTDGGYIIARAVELDDEAEIRHAIPARGTYVACAAVAHSRFGSRWAQAWFEPVAAGSQRQYCIGALRT